MPAFEHHEDDPPKVGDIIDLWNIGGKYAGKGPNNVQMWLPVWLSRDGRPWQQIGINPRGIVARHLAREEDGEIYDDGLGNRYCLTEPPNSPQP